MPKSVLHFQRFFFYFLDLLRILFFRFPLHCRLLWSFIELACSVTTQNILDMRPLGRKIKDLMENAQQ